MSHPPLSTQPTTSEKLNAEGSAGAVNAPPVPLRRASLAALLAGHILQDGEVVILILKPSLWFLVLSSLPFAAVASIMLIGFLMYTPNLSRHETLAYVEAVLVIVAGRLVWAILQWMGRFYILTDLRILRLGGVFSIELFDCPLRKIARTRVVASTLERIVRTGTIEIVPQEGAWALGNWQTIGEPKEVHEQIISSINRAKQGGGFPCA